MAQLLASNQKSSFSELGYTRVTSVTRSFQRKYHLQSSARSPACGRIHIVHVGLGVVRRPLLKKVRLALQGDHVHKVERVLGVVHFGIAERFQEMVGDELDVLTHKSRIHAD